MGMLSLAVGLVLILGPDKPAADPVSYWIDRAVTTGLPSRPPPRTRPAIRLLTLAEPDAAVIIWIVLVTAFDPFALNDYHARTVASNR